MLCLDSLFSNITHSSSQAPQALNIIQVVAKSTFPKLVGRLFSPHYQPPWADLDTFPPPPCPSLPKGCTGTQPFLWEMVSALLGTPESF